MRQTLKDPLLTPAQVAKALGLSKSSIYAYLKYAKIKGTRVGNLWYIRTSEVRRLLAETTATSAMPATEPPKPKAKPTTIPVNEPLTLRENVNTIMQGFDLLYAHLGPQKAHQFVSAVRA